MPREPGPAATPTPGSRYLRPLWLNERLGDADGRGVTVAVVDSGYGPPESTLPTGVVPGLGFVHPEHDLRLHPSHDYRDRLGHGTAVADVIRTVAPGVEIRPLRIFGRRLETSPEVLVAALDQAAEEGVGVINLSLGSPSESAREPLYAACERARRAGCAIISAVPLGAERVYPGAFDNVLSVTAGRFANAFDLALADESASAEFVASGTPLDPGGRFGSSLAAPHLSGLVALLRQRFPKADPQGVRTLLRELAASSTHP